MRAHGDDGMAGAWGIRMPHAHAIRPWTSAPANGAFRVAPVTRDPERCATPLPKRQATQANTANFARPRSGAEWPAEWGLGAGRLGHDDRHTTAPRRSVTVGAHSRGAGGLTR